jgi:hypothetical protein
MSPASEDNGPSRTEGESPDVLSKLPRTRPQRSSARRVAAREAASGNLAAASPAPTTPAGPAKPRAAVREKTSAAPRGAKVGPKVRPPSSSETAKARDTARTVARSSRTRTTAEPVPAQGFECENDRARGPVQPPGSSELAASAVELVGELAKAGFSRSERLLKNVLGRLPLS